MITVVVKTAENCSLSCYTHTVSHVVCEERCLGAKIGAVAALDRADLQASKTQEAEGEDHDCNEHFEQG